MTTYTYEGTSVYLDHITGAWEQVNDAELSIYAPAGETTVSYELGRQGQNSIFDTAEFSTNVSYYLNGEPIDTFGLEIYVFELEWTNSRGQSQTTTLLNIFDSGEFTDDRGFVQIDYLFQIGGDELPEINSISDYSRFLNSQLTGFDIGNGAFGPGEDISLAAAADSVTEDDLIYGSGTRDNLSGLNGDDMIFGEAGADTLKGNSGDDLLHGGRGKDNLKGGSGSDALNGDGGSDILLGGRGQDVLNGGAGKDNLKGGGGSDELNGNGGRDQLNGGGGNDMLTGGGGQDIFIFSGGDDVITDFNVNLDREVVNLEKARGITGFGDLMTNHLTETADGVLIEDARGNSILLEDVSAADLTANDFIF